jgi:hypothetical protein
MPTLIRIPKFTQELNDILELRFFVYNQISNQKTGLLVQNKKLIDPLDVFPSTKNFFASAEGKTIGAIRMSEFQIHNSIQNYSYNFDESVMSMGGKTAVLDMLCLTKEFRSTPFGFRDLLQMSLKTASDLMIDHVLFAAPVALLDFCKELGFDELGPRYQCAKYQVEMVPLCCHLKKYISGLESRFEDKEIFRFREIFYYANFIAGEVMSLQGERGLTAYFVNDGNVDVVLKSPAGLTKIASLPRGRLIGEIAMITGDPRNASLVVTEATSCVCFDRSDFLKLMYSEPHRSLDIFKLFSKRFAESNRKLAEAKQNAR